MNASKLTIWAVAAVAAVGVTTAAVTVANASSGPDEVMSQNDVARELAAETASPSAPPSAPPSPGATESPEPPPESSDAQTLRSEGGQLTVGCDGDSAWLETWSPNPGYRVDDVERGPASTVSVEFESDSQDDVEAFVQCQAGEPTLVDDVEPDDHGGDRDDDPDDDDDDRYDDDDPDDD